MAGEWQQIAVSYRTVLGLGRSSKGHDPQRRAKIAASRRGPKMPMALLREVGRPAEGQPHER
jgi:hypothetical protein